MSNPTSNFGWVMPTSTDLVTDLPADFAVFGQGVDTTMADLKGGTTGQILSKATNTDMDFTWVSANPGDITAVNVTSPITGGGSSGDVTVGIQASSTTQSGAVQLTDSTSSTSTTTAATPNSVKSAYDLANAAVPKSLVDAKADLITATADNTPARLAVGANETRLVADSVQATGLKYVADTTNFAINAKGDLLAGTAADTLTALTVGTNGQTLVADSTASTGLKWATPSSSASFTGVQATKITTNQSIPDSTYTVVTFNSEDFDTSGYHDNTTNSSRFTIPSGKAGYYAVSFNATFAGNSSNGGSGRRGFIIKNGAVAALNNSQSDVSSTVAKTVGASVLLNLAVADYIEVMVYQSSSSAINLLANDYSNVFSMTYLGA